MIKGLAITPPILGRISIGKVVEKNGKRLPEKDDQFTITSQIQSKEGWIKHPLDEQLRSKAPNQKLRTIPVRMIFNDPELNLRAEYTLFDRQTGRPVCVGNGGHAALHCRGHVVDDHQAHAFTVGVPGQGQGVVGFLQVGAVAVDQRVVAQQVKNDDGTRAVVDALVAPERGTGQVAVLPGLDAWEVNGVVLLRHAGREHHGRAHMGIVGRLAAGKGGVCPLQGVRRARVLLEALQVPRARVGFARQR